MTTTTVKIFIETQAFIPALIWVSAIEKKIGETLSSDQIWERSPKFVIGNFVTFLMLLLLAIQAPGLLGAAKVSTAKSNIFRVLFFVMTLFVIGLVSHFKKQ